MGILSDHKPPRFVISAVPANGVVDDGEGIMVRVQDERGGQIDLVAHYATFENLINALNEASAKAHDVRRSSTSVDQPISSGDIPLQVVTGYRLAAASDKSRLLLQVQTATGRIHIGFPASTVDDFRQSVERTVELLTSPERKN